MIKVLSMQREKSDITFDEYNDYEVITGTCKHSFPLHIHQCLCLGTITKGNVLFVCDNREIELKEGESYIITPNSPHAFTSISGNIYSYLTISLKNKTFKTSNLTEYISHAVFFIENSDLSILSVDDVCRFVNVSKFHFTRAFKNEVGITPHQFILNQKIKKIRQGIVSQQSLSDLSLDYGFSDQSHLCNTFKKYMGVSPLQFYAKHRTHYSSAGENFAKI